MNIHNSVIFITGANRGLGLAFAQEALKRGARKVYAGVRTPTSENIPGIIQIKLDVTDPASINEAVTSCNDTTILINNAGIVRLNTSSLEDNFISVSREIFETNYYGTVRVSCAFAPTLSRNGGGAIINVLSDATWFSRPILASYSASKSAAWSYTNALRIDLRDQNTLVQALHVSFMDTDMTKDSNMTKISPSHVAAVSLSAVEQGQEEVRVDKFTQRVKNSLSSEKAIYLSPPDIA